MFKYELKDGSTSIKTSYGTLNISPNPANGFKPIELLVSSIVGCSSGIFQKILDKKRIDVDQISIEASVERNEKEANKVTKINLHYIISGKNVSEKQVQKSLEVTINNCGMIQSVKDSIIINESFEIIEVD